MVTLRHELVLESGQGLFLAAIAKCEKNKWGLAMPNVVLAMRERMGSVLKDLPDGESALVGLAPQFNQGDVYLHMCVASAEAAVRLEAIRSLDVPGEG